MSSAGLLGATPGISDAVAMYSKNGVQKGKKNTIIPTIIQKLCVIIANSRDIS